MKKYSETHEWVELEAPDIALIGLSHHAQTLLGDIAFLELPKVGAHFKQGEAIGVIESVKSASDFYAPVSGVVLAINEAAMTTPSHLNNSAEKTWLVRLKLSSPGEYLSLINAEKYEEAIHGFQS